MMFKRFWAILRARLIEYRRDKAALIWSLVFPFLLVIGFGLMFSGDGKALYKIGLLGEKQQSGFLATKHLQFIDYQDNDSALLKLQQHGLDLVIDVKQRQYWVNEMSANGYIAEKLLLQQEPDFVRKVFNGRQIRYVDWVVPGILAMNMMFGCFFGVGFIIVRYRKNLVLKRLQATPLRAVEFIAAQIVSRLLIVLLTLTLVYSCCNYLFGFYMIGSYFDLIIVALLGALSLISMALILASRSASEELTNGLLNFASMPMMLLSGMWFSLEGTPQAVQTIAQFIPLTHLLEAARAIMAEGKTLWQVKENIAALLVMTGVFCSAAAMLFSWKGDGAR